MAVKLGPVGMQFLVDVKLLERDDGGPRGEAQPERARHARQGRGRGHGRLPADRPRRRRHPGRDGHRPAVLRPGGPARAALVVQDVSNKLVNQFADCIKAQLSAPPEQAAKAVRAGAEADLRVLPDAGALVARSNESSAVETADRGGGGVKHITVTVNGVRHEADVEERELLVYFLREGLGLHGHQRRLRHLVVRGLHGPSRRRVGQVAAPCWPFRPTGREVTTIEGLADQRRDAPDADRLPGAPRAPVRLLHARDDHGGGRAS